MYAAFPTMHGRPLVMCAQWWILAMVVLSLSAIYVPRIASPQSIALPGGISSASIRKDAGPLSARLAMLARTNPAARARALSLPAQGPGSLFTDAAGNPLVYITLARVDQPTVAALTRAGARVVHVSNRYNVVTAAVAPGMLQTVAAVPGVQTMREALAPGRRDYGQGASRAAALQRAQASQ